MTDKILYAGSRDGGKVKIWKATSDFVVNSKGFIDIVTEWGFQGFKMQTKIIEVKAGKNKGKSNETTIQQQAQLKIDQLYQGKIDDGMVYDISLYEIPQNPMLAKPFAERAEHITYIDCYEQDKLNGMRCWVERVKDEITFKSRTGKFFTPFPHIAAELLLILKDGDKRDGELFHFDYEFEAICSEGNKSKNADREGWMQYHCYDAISVDGNQPFKERLKNVESIPKHFKYVIPVKAKFIKDFTVEILNKDCLDAMERGYEGIMIRDPDALYEYSTSPSHRSDGLLKYKLFEDAEFQIVNILPAENEPDQPMFVLQITKDILTPVRLKGSKTDNTVYLQKKEDYIRKWMKTQFQCYTKAGDLSFPVGLGIRKGEEIDGEFVPEQ